MRSSSSNRNSRAAVAGEEVGWHLDTILMQETTLNKEAERVRVSSSTRSHNNQTKKVKKKSRGETAVPIKEANSMASLRPRSVQD